jgi:DNA-binding transcriptional ArsR family regulator
MESLDSVRIGWSDVPDEQRAAMKDSWNNTVPNEHNLGSKEPRSNDGSKDPSKYKPETGDRFRTLNAFVDATMRELTPSEKIVWFVLFREVRNGVANVAQDDIAARSGLTQPTVSLAIQRLVGRGLVRVVRQGGFRSGPSTYVVRGAL